MTSKHHYPLSLSIGITIASLVSPSVSSSADDPNSWAGSYWADGRCYCANSLDAALSGTLVPTPVGGQTVAQICGKIGQGPGLVWNGEQFNYPAYADPQCGNGPFQNGKKPASSICAGTLDPQGDDCQPAQTGWDLAALYGVANAEPASASAIAEDASETVAGADKQVGSDAPAEETVAPATEDSTNNNLPADFAGQTIVIGGQRYVQANSKVAAEGGAPGSRIVVDGIVFLKDDGALELADLFQKPRRRVEPEPQPSAVEPVSAPTVARTTRPESTLPSTEVDVPVVPEREIRDAIPARVTAEMEQVPAENDEVSSMPAVDKDQAGLLEGSEGRVDEVLDSVDDELASVAPNAGEELQGPESLPPLAPNTDASLPAAGDTVATDRVPEERPTVTADNTDTETSGGAAEPRRLASRALMLPVGVRQSSTEFSYVEAAQSSYDIGGNGLRLEGSASVDQKIHFIGRAGVASEYREVMLGAGYYLTPANANRLTVVLTAGIEYGSFELSDTRLNGSLDYDDTGFHAGLASRMVLSSQFEIQGGVGYSSFFEGDATLFGRGLYHLNRQLDLISNFELGDNDSFGLGVRFYY